MKTTSDARPLPIAARGPEADAVDARTRRFLATAAGVVRALGCAGLAVPFVKSLEPDASVAAATTAVVDLTEIALGAQTAVNWQDKPAIVSATVAAPPGASIVEPASATLATPRVLWLLRVSLIVPSAMPPTIGSLYAGPEQGSGRSRARTSAADAAPLPEAPKLPELPPRLSLFT